MPKHFYLRLFLFATPAFLFFFGASCQPGYTDDNLAPVGHSNRPSAFIMVTGNGGKSNSWFSPVWMTGAVNLSGGASYPQPGEVLYLNYDKATDRVYSKTGNTVLELPTMDIESFRLNDSLGTHTFVKIPLVSKSRFFEELTDGAEGFTLYRKLISRLSAADDVASSYVTHENSVPYYVDYSHYYLFQPGKKKHLDFYLSEVRLRKKLSALSPVAGKFMEEHPGTITQQLLLRLCDVLNEK